MTSPKDVDRLLLHASSMVGCFEVKLYDIVQQQITGALESIRKQMKELEESGFLKGALSAEKQLALISGCTDLKAAVEGAAFIQVTLISETALVSIFH
uniref:Crystallin lambda 1 n=1 Tax=Apteryx owenii TaxID=8824 RepID=A0A8B9NX99_APTOW